MPSLGNDLKKIRNHLGYSVEDLRKATKLPLDTIKSIEDGTIFSDPHEINTYVRSFVRTYGRALKLDNDLMSKALDQEELGNYTDLLLRKFPELMEEEPEKPERPPTDLAESDKKDTEEEKDQPPKKKRKKGTPSFHFAEEDNESENVPDDEPAKKPASVQRGNDSSGSSSPPDVRSIDWAGMGKGFKKKRSQPPVWMISAGLMILLIIAAAVLISQFGFFSSDDEADVQPGTTEMQEPANEQNLSLDLSEEMPDQTEPEPVLSDTLQLTLYAAYGRLDPVRVWSDLKPRIDPYWLDEGTAYNFEFIDTIRVRGSYSDMLMFLNGNRIDDARAQYYNVEESAVELTRDIFNSDPRWATQVPFELPEGVAEPDTTVNRPSF